MGFSLSLSRKITIALVFLGAISCYISLVFNSCLVTNLSKNWPKWHQNHTISNDVLEFHYSSSVRVVSLLGENETDISPKYKLFKEQGLRPEKQLPNALIIGVKKGGTRALLEFIRLHPDVRAAGSEIHFFDKNYEKGFNWYRNQMPPTLEGQLTIEKTPSYFVTKDAPKRVHLMNPSTKLLVVVRDPVTRAISDYTQAISKHPEMKPFEKLVFNKGLDSNNIDTSYGPVKLGLYHRKRKIEASKTVDQAFTQKIHQELKRAFVRYLTRWLKYFPLSQLLFISGERLILDPAIELKRVQDFLGLKQVVTEKHFYFNTTKGFPCLFKSESNSTPHCLGKTKGRNHPYVDPTALQKLRNFYRPFNKRFYQMTAMSRVESKTMYLLLLYHGSYSKLNKDQRNIRHS